MIFIDAGNLVDNEIRKFDCPVAAVCFGLFDIPIADGPITMLFFLLTLTVLPWIS